MRIKGKKNCFIVGAALLFVISLTNLAAAYLLSPEESAVIVLVNQQRSLQGLSPLWHNAELSLAAKGHSEDMAVNDFFSHTGSDDSAFWDRADRAGYNGFARGECIGAGFPTAESMVAGWMDSDGHRAIILDSSADRIGVGYVSEPLDTLSYYRYWTLDTGIGGSIAHTPVPPAILLLGSGLLGLGVLGWRRKRN